MALGHKSEVFGLNPETTSYNRKKKNPMENGDTLKPQARHSLDGAWMSEAGSRKKETNACVRALSYELFMSCWGIRNKMGISLIPDPNIIRLYAYDTSRILFFFSCLTLC